MADEKDAVFSHLARIQIPNTERSAQLRALLGDRAEDDLYLFDAEISNTLLDSHFTHMSESTLRNYADDATAGVAFLRGHNWRELPIGYSLSGVLSEESGRKRVMAGFYTVRGIPDTDDLIKRMEARLVRDVSVGFHGGRAICDLCGADFWDCRHFPGLKYESKEGDTVKTELATFTIEDARLSEVSGVFDGSTPEAMVRKAQQHAAQGLLNQKQIEVLEQRYRTRLAVRTVHPVKEERKMDEKELNELKTLLGVGSGDAIVSRSKEVVTSLATAEARIKDLEPQAAEGRQYRADLVTSALAEGVRAHGNDFKTEEYKTILESAPLSTIKSMSADWKRVADAALPGGRRSADGAERTKVVETEIYPDAAYQ